MSIAKHVLLGVGVSATVYDEAAGFVMDHAREGRACRITALDAHGLAKAAKLASFRDLLGRFDLVTPDGHSLRWGLNRLYGCGLPDRVSGPELTLHVCRRAAAEGLPVYAYGSHAHVVEGFVRALGARCPGLRVAGFRPSRFRPATPEEDRDDVEVIRRSGARLVFVGLGCPLQEQWVDAHADALAMPLLAVGAAFDFLSGNKPRAPRWMQRSGLEWVFRIAVEPRRLICRSIPAVTYVGVALARQMLGREAKQR